jgi:hypothetical protein
MGDTQEDILENMDKIIKITVKKIEKLKAEMDILTDEDTLDRYNKVLNEREKLESVLKKIKKAREITVTGKRGFFG